MKTKHIWIGSLVFGALATGLLYMKVFSHLSEPTATRNTVENQTTKVSNGTEVQENQVKRSLKNPILSISEGKRAVSVKVKPEEGVSGYIEPGSKVDVISYKIIQKEAGRKEEIQALLVLQNAKVLTSGQSSNTEGEALRYDTVTLELTPEEGMRISLAMKDGTGLYFMLRNQRDNELKQETVVQHEFTGEVNRQ